jgi:quercetin dioxygenase-like cupin family protein
MDENWTSDSPEGVEVSDSIPPWRSLAVFTSGAIIGVLGGPEHDMTTSREDVMTAEPTTVVLAADDGEHLLNASGEVVIKIDPRRGSAHLSLGTQHVPSGAGIPRHRHAYWDEFIYVLDGSGTVILNNERVPIQKGATIFISTGAWHGFENPGTELFILWATTPTGQEEFFRAISSRPGEPPKQLTPEQVLAIRQKVEADHLNRIAPR